MKITFLGTSHGNPTNAGYNTSVLLEEAGRYYLIDAGEPADASVIRQGVDPSQLSGIFITHAHLDHTGGLPYLCSQTLKHRKKFPHIRTIVLVPEEKLVTGMAAWDEANHHENAGDGEGANIIKCYVPCRIYDDCTLKVSAYPNDHLKHVGGKSYSLKVTVGEKNILFTGDLSADFHDFPLDAAQDCDVVVSELTHYKLEAALPMLAQLRTGQLVFYHLHDPWQTEEGKAKALALTAHLGYPVTLAYDGFKLDV